MSLSYQFLNNRTGVRSNLYVQGPAVETAFINVPHVFNHFLAILERSKVTILCSFSGGSFTLLLPEKRDCFETVRALVWLFFP